MSMKSGCITAHSGKAQQTKLDLGADLMTIMVSLKRIMRAKSGLRLLVTLTILSSDVTFSLLHDIQLHDTRVTWYHN